LLLRGASPKDSFGGCVPRVLRGISFGPYSPAQADAVKNRAKQDVRNLTDTKFFFSMIV